MPKNDILTEEEFLRYHPNDRIQDYIESFRKKNNLEKNQINILDWGCGRGRYVLWLREKGYNAFGVDIDLVPIKNGIDLFRKKGYDDSLLVLIDHDGKTPFPDNFFHFICSNQVFEHVRNIEFVIAELQRITVKGGAGFHIYPAHKYIVEGHLFMPFVHWLPKNRIRKFLIFIYLCVNIDPGWEKLKNRSIREKSEMYYKYSIEKTFYRKYSYISKIFRNYGFHVIYKTIDHPKIRGNRFFKILLNINLLRPVINHFIHTFKSVELFISKI